ncbi:MAG: alpha-mannosidase [Clostridia bacterium]|nr:alpha-mannosidase [Clostridia bacterium]
MKKAYIVTHTHWDREWRYPIWENRQYLIDMIDELLEILDTQPEYSCFLMDGQSVIIEDYLEMKPQNRKKVEDYIKAGKIDVGPWYTLPDLYPVCGESLIRNLLKGDRLSKKLGRRLNVAHESFGWGQTAQLPQIYKGFGLDFVVVAKNVSKDRCPDCEFLWEAPDGTRVLATRLGEHARANFFMNAFLAITTDKDYNSDEYYMQLGRDGQVYHEADDKGFWEDYFVIQDNGKIHTNRLKEAIRLAWEAMDETVLPDNRLLMNGSDSSTAQPQLVEIIKTAQQLFPDIELKLSTLEEYVEDFKRLVDKSKLKTIKGELRDGPAYKCSANALATRPKIKVLNKKAENAIFKIAEPLSVMEDQYNSAFLDKAVDYLLLSHPHDSINGVTQDKTADDTVYRLNQALEIAETVSNTACKNIVKNIDFSGYDDDDMIIVLFNTLPYKRNETIKLYIDFPQTMNVWDFDIYDGDRKLDKQIISRKEVVTPVSNLHTRPLPYEVDRFEVVMETGNMPAMGYKTVRAVKTEDLNRKTVFWHDMRKYSGNELITGVNTMENEFLKARVEQNGTLTLTEKATGREYKNLNYFEETGDHGDYWIYYPPYHNKTYNTLGANAQIWYEENGELSSTICARIKMNVPSYGIINKNMVEGESKRSGELTEIEIKTYYTLKKGARAVEVKTVINNTAKDHRMRAMFDTGIKTSTAKSAGHFYVDERSTAPAGDRYYPEMQTLPKGYYTTLEDEHGGFSFVDNCTCEYEATKDGKLAITLFRGVRNIICTEFRSAGVFPHEDGGQSLGELTFNYCIYPFNRNETKMLAEKLSAPVKAVQTSKGDGKRGDTASFLEIPDELVLTALKKAEDSNNLIIRLFNPTKQSVTGEFKGRFKNARAVNLNEEFEKDLDLKEVTVKPYEILTIEAEKTSGHGDVKEWTADLMIKIKNML